MSAKPQAGPFSRYSDAEWRELEISGLTRRRTYFCPSAFRRLWWGLLGEIEGPFQIASNGKIPARVGDKAGDDFVVSRISIEPFELSAYEHKYVMGYHAWFKKAK